MAATEPPITEILQAMTNGVNRRQTRQAEATGFADDDQASLGTLDQKAQDVVKSCCCPALLP